MTRRYLWALLLVVIGLWILLHNFGVVPGFSWGVVGPVILILIGLSLLLGRRGRGEGMRSEPATVPLDGATSAHLTFQHGAGRLRVSAGAPEGQLLAGSFVGGVDTEVTRRGDVLGVVLHTPRQEWSDWVFPWNWWGRNNGFEWDVHLSATPVYALSFETGAGEGRIDLMGLRVTDLTVKTGASSTNLVLPSAAGLTRAHFSVGVAGADVTVPSGVAARISGAMGLGSLRVDESRFPKRDGAYESTDFGTAANKVDLRIEGGLGAVNVR